MSDHGESRRIGKEPCPDCGSRDNLVRFDDGHAYCFTAGCGRYEPGDGQSSPSKPKARMDLIQGEIEHLPHRGITRETCERYGYQVTTLPDGRPAHLAPYRDAAGRPVAQKVRLPGKDFFVAGDTKHGRLFGQHLLRADGGKMVVITEGEIDAMSASQALGNRWPVLSIPFGATNAAKDLAPHIGELEKYDAVVLSFDMDEAGRKAVDDVIPLFTPGKLRVAHLPEGVKDANDLVKANRSKELSDALWGASAYRPDGIRSVADLKTEALTPTGFGLPWPWRSLTVRTRGIRRRYMYGWGAGVGSGKTTTFKQVMLTAMRPDLLEDHAGISDYAGVTLPIPEPRRVGTILFEENPAETLRSLGGMIIGKRVDDPAVSYDEAELAAAIDSLDGLLFTLDTFGAKDWSSIKANILFLVLSEGIKDIFLDPLTALVANTDDERRALDAILADLSGMVEAHDFTLHYISHLTTPAGTPHEEGGRVMEKHFTGSRALARWTHAMFGLERDKQSDKPTLVRGLKDRKFGDAVGPLLALQFDRDTGRMVEVPLETLNDETPFGDETHNADI